jgi:hypothetical protein
MVVDFFIEIKFGEHLGTGGVLACGADFALFFYFNAAESLAWRGFREADFAKYCCQRA